MVAHQARRADLPERAVLMDEVIAGPGGFCSQSPQTAIIADARRCCRVGAGLVLPCIEPGSPERPVTPCPAGRQRPGRIGVAGRIAIDLAGERADAQLRPPSDRAADRPRIRSLRTRIFGPIPDAVLCVRAAASPVGSRAPPPAVTRRDADGATG
mgnify:CR=1 FL=1